MKTDGKTLRGIEMVTPHVHLESVKEWVKRKLTQEVIADIVVCASTVTILGTVLHMLHRALENRAIVGF